MRDALGSVQSVLLLGGTSEIGLATLRALIAERARTVVVGVRDPDGFAHAEELRAAGATTVDVVRFDALDTVSHEQLVSDVFDRHGDIDVIVLAFGVLGDQEESERDAHAALAVVRTNYDGAVSVALPFARRLRVQGHGTLVALSSVAGERARRSNFVYGSSKAGLDALVQGLADSLAGSGARAMAVRPGFVRTKMTAGLEPAPLSTTPEAVAKAIADGIRSGAHTVWVPRPLRFVMLALRLLPRPLFRRLDI